MAGKTAKDQVNGLKNNAKSMKESFEAVKKSAENAPDEIKKKLEELEQYISPIQEAADTLIPKNEQWEPVRGFIRRILSREVLIAVATIVTIAVGNLGAQEAIGVAVAGTGLILGRSVVKARQKNNVN